MNITYKDPVYLFAILAICFFWYGSCQKNKVLELKAESVKAQHQEQLKALENKAAVFKASADAEKKARELSRDSARSQQRAGKWALAANLDSIKSLKQKLATRLTENPDINELVVAQERAYKKLDSLYRGSELQHEAEIVSYEKELKDRAEELMIERVKTNVWRDAAVSYEKERNKLTRGKKVRNILIGGLVLWGIYESVKE